MVNNKKYLIDASIIASSLEDFKRRFISAESTLVLCDLTLKELEDRKKTAVVLPTQKNLSVF